MNATKTSRELVVAEQLSRIIYRICGANGSSVEHFQDINHEAWKEIFRNDKDGNLIIDKLQMNRVECLSLGLDIVNRKIHGKTVEQLRGFRFHIYGIVTIHGDVDENSDQRAKRVHYKVRELGSEYTVLRSTVTESGKPSVLSLRCPSGELDIGAEALTRLILVGLAR